MRAAVAFMIVTVAGCVPAPNDTGDASTDGSSNRRPLPDVILPDVHEPTCGDVSCSEPASSEPLGEGACCLASGACGLASSVLGTECLPRHAPGGVDLTCPGRFIPGGLALPGCCGANGRCGLLDPTGELGCIAAGVADAAACRFDPRNDCSNIATLPCDGPEDCKAGQVCCGRARRDRYDLFGCFASCDGLFDGQSGVWVEICHPGSACLNAHYKCEPSAILPSFLARCHDPGPPPAPVPRDGAAEDASIDATVDAPTPRDADQSSDEPAAMPPVPGIACGQTACAPGENCCMRTHALTPSEAGAPAPIDPYCSKAGVICACSPEIDP